MTISNYNIKIDAKNFYDQPINNLIKQYEKVRKISTGQGDDYKTGCLLDYAYFKHDFKLIAADLSKQKALDADPKAIQQIIFTGQVDDEALIVFYIFEKSKETILQFSKRMTKVLWIILMVEYSKKCKIDGYAIKKIKTAVKNKTGTTLRMSLKMLDGNDLPHELLLTTRQKTKLRNACQEKYVNWFKAF